MEPEGSLSFSKEPVIGIHTQANESIPYPNIQLIQIHPNITSQYTPKYSNKSATFKFYNQIVPEFFIHNMCGTVHALFISFSLISFQVMKLLTL